METVNIRNRQQRNIEVKVYEANQAKANFIIAHGASEHIMRYDHLASFLQDNNINVFGYNHLGHGLDNNDQGIYFTKKNGHIELINDLEDVCLYAYTQHSELPLFIFGHSMGSLIARGFAIRSRLKINGMIICGSMNPPTQLIKSGLVLAKTITKVKGEKKTSKLLNKMTLGDLESSISYNKENINNYHTDPWCGKAFTNKAIVDLLMLTKLVGDHVNISLMMQSNYFFISGQDDPFSKGTKQVMEVIDEMKKTNPHVDYKFYQNAKHEILKESLAPTVFQDILDFINKVINLK
ncbi:MAG: lysophospholipase [Bacilli bacterium]|jgi:alpha-beta hydrolase superfamily lysophospholipase|nr:lysophospholipase [Bacilli bacterium]